MKWYEEILKEAYDYLDARYNHKIADEVEKQAVSLVRAEMEKALKNITEASQLIETTADCFHPNSLTAIFAW